MKNFPKLHASYENANVVVSGLKFDSAHPQHKLGMMYAAQMIETAYALLILGKSKSSASNFLLARCILETGVRLMYLAKNPDIHYRNLELEDYVSREKAMSILQTEEPSALMGGKLAEVSSSIKVLKKKNAVVLPLEQMLNALEAQTLYRYFRRLSSSAHSQILGLSHQFLKKNHGSYEVNIFSPSTEEQDFYVNELTPYFLDSIKTSLLALKMEAK
jgi:Family of unknown function (DUF5677)